MERASGILMPVFSLPSKYGIGDFGQTGYKFVDFLSKSKQKFWQILPLVQTGYGNSPYSSISSRSFSPYYISVEELFNQGLLTEQELKTSLYDGEYVSYEFLYNVRLDLLRKAYSRFDKQGKKFKSYVKSGESRDYALFMALKQVNEYKPFYEWQDEYKYRDINALLEFEKAYSDEVLFWQFVQFLAKTQWLKLKKYANKKGISISGDMPLYVALDSVDVWVEPTLYKLDKKFTPKKVAGVPPDYFCEDGQLWGNPVYDYSKHKKQGYKWWVERILNALDIFDYVRIDHFRGLDRYYEIENGAPNAKSGEWIKVPSKALFSAIHKRVDKKRIIAEDLGMIDDGVRALLKRVGYPGMKILSFAFNGDQDNLYLPERVNENSVCYTGTHDNDTLIGLINNASDWDRGNLYNGVRQSIERLNLNLQVYDTESLASSIIELGFACKSNLFVIPMQDLLRMGSEMRTNEPGTIKEQNWSVKFSENHFSTELSNHLKQLTKKYNR